MSATTEVIKKQDFFRLRYYQRRFAGPVLETVFADPDACFVDGQSKHILKHDRTTTLVTIGGNEKNWVAKRYNTKNAWHAVRRCFARSRAINCWEMSFALQAAGLRTADPIAVIEQRFGPLRRRSFYFCEYVTGTPLEKIINPGASQQQLDDMCSAFTDMFSKLSAARIAHGDMKFTNLLWVDNEVALLDLDAAAVYSAERYTRAYHKDRDRFLRNWDHLPEFRTQLAAAIPEHPSPIPAA